jgi:hypothetical protein
VVWTVFIGSPFIPDSACGTVCVARVDAISSSGRSV